MVLEINDRIRVRRLEFFQNFEVQLKYDSIGSAFRFDYLFDPDNIEHKEMSCVGHYHIVQLRHAGKLLMTGFALNNHFDDSPQKKLSRITGYSLPGVLQDCEIPFGEPSSWLDSTKSYAKRIINKIWPGTLQSDGLSLQEIAEKIIAPFELQMVVDSTVAADMLKPYEETTAKEKQSAKSYLCELAAQKNIIVTDDEFGRIVFTRPKPNRTPVFHFERNIPGTSMSLDFNGAGMHSSIKVYQQQDVDEEIPASENKIDNPYVPFVFRPHVVTQNSGEADDTLNAARNILSKELKNLVLTIETDRWGVRSDGKLLRPGDIITVKNPNVYLYNKSEWFIEEVHLKGSPSETTATIKCVPPEVYNGQTPKYLFSGINLH